MRKGSENKKLLAALKSGCTRSFNACLKRGANPDIAGSTGIRPLHYAAAHNKHKLVSSLVAAGANVGFQTIDGKTPSHYAAEKNAQESLAVLLGAGADINVPDKNRQTALHLSAIEGCEQSVAKILAYQGDVNAKDFLGMTPVHRAAESKSLESMLRLVMAEGELLTPDLSGEVALAYAPETWARFLEVVPEFVEFPVKMAGVSDVDRVYNNGHLQKETRKKNIIYSVFDEDELVYIGSTIKGASRIKQHIDKTKNGKADRLHKHGYWLARNKAKWADFGIVFLELSDEKKDLREVEHKMISYFKPKLNVMGKNWVYDMG